MKWGIKIQYLLKCKEINLFMKMPQALPFPFFYLCTIYPNSFSLFLLVLAHVLNIQCSIFFRNRTSRDGPAGKTMVTIFVQWKMIVWKVHSQWSISFVLPAQLVIFSRQAGRKGDGITSIVKIFFYCPSSSRKQTLMGKKSLPQQNHRGMQKHKYGENKSVLLKGY